MLSSVESSLWANELLKVLGSDPNLSNDTKKAFKSIQHKTNTWKNEIETLWRGVDYPALSESDVIRLNCVTRKDIEAKNRVRANQRSYYLSVGDEHAASMIPDIVDSSMSAKECIVKSDVRCQGWIPNNHCYSTILYNKKPDMSCLAELVEKCSHSGAINLPKTIINVVNHGVESGYGESHFGSIFLQLIREQLPESFLAAQTYATDTSQLFNYLLNLIDTTGEISKCRTALKNITRKTGDSISIVILKIKAITTSLYFLVSPHASLDSITRKADKSAIEAIYSLVSDSTKNALVKWKRRATELDKQTTLADFLECVAALEADDGFKISRDLKLPQRFSESDVTCFFTRFNMRKPSLQRSRDPTPARSDGKNSRSNSQSSNGGGRPHSSNGGRPHSSNSSRGEGKNKRDKKNDEERGRSRTRRENQHDSAGKKEKKQGEYNPCTNTNKCKKCMGRHSSAECIRYPFFYDKPCHLCKNNGRDLFHPSSLCRFSKSRYITPSPEKSPVSFNRKKDDGNNEKKYFY